MEEILKEIEEQVDRMMINTINNKKLPTTEHIEGYMLCRMDVIKIIERAKNGSKGFS